jgi:purine-cytosine permease-like protein
MSPTDVDQAIMRPDEADNRFGHIEERGIDLVPESKQGGRPIELFWTWLAGNSSVGYIVVGALVVYMGLSLGQAVIALVIGNLAFFTVGVTSLQGPQARTTTFMISRAAYGPDGNRFMSFFNWITLVGFEASSIALIVLAGRSLLNQAGVKNTSGTPLTIAVIIVALLVQLMIPLLGHATILVIQKYLSYVFVPLYVVMAILVAPKVHLGTIHTTGGLATISVAIAMVASGGGLSWSNCGSDYSRYMSPKASHKGIFWWSSLGGLLAAGSLELLGSAIASVTKAATNPIAGLPKILPAALLVPFLLLFVATLWSSNGLDLYSSGLSLQALGLRFKRVYCVAIDLVISGVLAAVTVFSSNFNTYFSDFLGLLVLWLAPWFAIYSVDWLLRRTYDPESLADSNGGIYRRFHGVHIPAVVAQVLGMVAAALWINTSVIVGPISSRAGHSDLSVFMGIIVAGLAYWAMERIPTLRRLTHPSSGQAAAASISQPE